MSNKEKSKPIILLAVILLAFYCYPVLQLVYAKVIGVNIITEGDKIVFNISDDLAVLLKLMADITFAGVLFFIYRKTIIEDFKKFFKNLKNILPTSLLYWGIGLFVMAISNIVIAKLTGIDTSTNQENVIKIIKAAPILALLITTVIAPFTEEIVFRKTFKNAIQSKIPFILISGIAFGAIHIISSFDNPLGLLYIIPYSALGIAFGAIYYKTDNIFSTISIHMLHNGILVLLKLLI